MLPRLGKEGLVKRRLDAVGIQKGAVLIRGSDKEGFCVSITKFLRVHILLVDSDISTAVQVLP